MAMIDVDLVLGALGVRAVDDPQRLAGGMSGSTVLEARGADGEPLVVKVTSLATHHLAEGARRELFVCRELAAQTAIPMPRVIAAQESDEWIAIALEKLEPSGPASSWTAAQWTDLARLLGRLHRSARDVLDVPPTVQTPPPCTVDELRSSARRMWDAPGDAERISSVLDRRQGMRAALHAGPRSFVHGDCHVGNVVRGSDGAPLLVDWQSARVGPSAGDIAFALTRAAAAADQVPRDLVLEAYCAAAEADPALTRRCVAAHQLLTLVEQYPDYAEHLVREDVIRLRRTVDELLGEWTDED